MAEAIADHASAYDSDPTRWERTREEMAETAGVETEKFGGIAKGLAAMDVMNKDVR
jgi:hypothetical protein